MLACKTSSSIDTKPPPLSPRQTVVAFLFPAGRVVFNLNSSSWIKEQYQEKYFELVPKGRTTKNYIAMMKFITKINPYSDDTSAPTKLYSYSHKIHFANSTYLQKHLLINFRLNIDRKRIYNIFQNYMTMLFFFCVPGGCWFGISPLKI